MAKKLTTTEFIDRAKHVHGDKYDYSETVYTKSRNKVKIKCKTHNLWFDQIANDHLSGKGCSKCSGNYRKNTDDFIHISSIKHNNMYDYTKTKYSGAHSEVIITCSIHGDFKQSANNHLRGQGCPVCRTSKGESEIANILNSLGISYIREYKFKDCCSKRPLPFDFYLPDHNTCIEYDGEQHFSSRSFRNNRDENRGFKQVQLHDSIKTEFCNDMNIRLIRIPYTEFNDIRQILKKELI